MRIETDDHQASLPGDHRALEPPDPIPNSEVKRCIADGSVGFPHVRVGHRQALIQKRPSRQSCGVVFRLGVAFYEQAALDEAGQTRTVRRGGRRTDGES